MLQASVILY